MGAQRYPIGVGLNEKLEVGNSSNYLINDGTDVSIYSSGDVLIVPTGGKLHVWHASKAAGDYVSIYHDSDHGYIIPGSGQLILKDATSSAVMRLSNGNTIDLYIADVADTSGDYIRMYSGSSTAGTNEPAPIGFMVGYNINSGANFGSMIIGSRIDTNVPKYAAAFTSQAEPTFAVFGGVDINTRITQHSIQKYNEFSLGDYGSRLGLKYKDELITIAEDGTTAVGGAGFVPANCKIVAFTYYVTQIGGGGGLCDMGRTNGGNLDEFADVGSTTSSFAAVGNSGNSWLDGDGAGQAEIYNASADTITVTVNAAVTTTDAIVRIQMWYRDLTEASA